MKLYLDFETFLIQPGCQAPPIVCAVMAADEGSPRLLHARFDPLFSELDGYLRDPSVEIVAHNAAFEVTVMMAARPDWTPLLFEKLRRGKIRCTEVREKLIRIAQIGQYKETNLGACLDAWGIESQVDKSSPWRVRYGTLADVPCSEWPSEARDYVLADLAVRELFLAQESRASYIRDEAQQVRASVALKLTSSWGITTDPAKATELIARVELDVKEAEATILAAGLARSEKGRTVKTKKAAEDRITAAYTSLGREVPRGDPTEKMESEGKPGNVKLDEEACMLSGDPVLEAYTTFSQASTLLSKARRLLKSPIQCRYNSLVATGRTSCSQGDDPKPGEAWSAYGMQVQNLPRGDGVREAFVARPGHAIVSVDYDAFEMRTWAYCTKRILGFSDLAEILNDPKRCPHVEMGAGLMDISLEAAYALKGDERKKLRGLAKGPNFGLPGGMGPEGLQDYCRLSKPSVDLTLDEAKNACRVWRKTYREAQPYLDWISVQIGKWGGRAVMEQLVSRRLRAGVGYCDYSNGIFQGLAADIAKDAGWRLAEQAYEIKSSALYGCRPLVFVHDEWLYEVPLDRLTEAGNLMAEIMTKTAMDWCPDVLFTASPAAMLAWSKSAGDPVRDKNGNLIPYEWKDKT